MDISEIMSMGTDETYFDTSDLIPGSSKYERRQSMKQLEPKISKYRHKGINTLFFLQPNSFNIYLLDFKLQSFVKENLYAQEKLPTGFTSVQLASGLIVVMGGIQNNQVLNKITIINDQLVTKQVSQLKVARYSVPLALIQDRYVMAAGGVLQTTSSSTKKYTNAVELYDVASNQVFQLADMEKMRAHTSMAVVKNRHVFIFNGIQNVNFNSLSSSHAIEYIDLG
jgi:hypothetical protein